MHDPETRILFEPLKVAIAMEKRMALDHTKGSYKRWRSGNRSSSGSYSRVIEGRGSFLRLRQRLASGSEHVEAQKLSSSTSEVGFPLNSLQSCMRP
jgi:hypothetical protein